MQKSIVISMMKPMITLRTYAHHMQRGTTRDASSTSSARKCEPESNARGYRRDIHMWTMLSEPISIKYFSRNEQDVRHTQVAIQDRDLCDKASSSSVRPSTIVNNHKQRIVGRDLRCKNPQRHQRHDETAKMAKERDGFNSW